MRKRWWAYLGIKFLLDALLWVAAAPLAFLLRIDDLSGYLPSLLFYTLVGVPLKIVFIWLNGLFRHSWRRSSIHSLFALLQAVGLLTVVMGGVTWAWRSFGLSRAAFTLPRSIPLIEGMLALLLMGGARVFSRGAFEYWRRRQSAAPQGNLKRVLVVGAGEAGSLLVREMQHHLEAGLLPIAFVDDDPLKQGTHLLGLPVVGPVDELPSWVEAYRIDEVLIAMPSASGKVVRDVVHLCEEAKVAYRIMPALHDILSGKVLISQVRPVQLEDLLRREPVHLDLHSIAAYISGKTVLVTGAGGSIGSEIVRQVLRFRPERVVLLGRGENSIYELSKELRFEWPEARYEAVIADIRDRDRLFRVLERYRPQVVFHAAAHKHVPLMEMQPEEAVLNNVFGTLNLVEASQAVGVRRFVNISTDKAVNPTSVMGASKRVAEFIVQAAAAKAQPEQVFVSVRFGNVLGSRGSVVPLFREQIRRGGPVTVTHPDMRRYFMTIPEAAQLVLQAVSLGENGAVYVLDMGEMVKIVDLARDLIRLSGYTEEEVPIVFTGLRPGEKLYEELLTAEEGVDSTRHRQIFAARVRPVEQAWLAEHLQALREAAKAGDGGRVREVLQAMIPTYTPWGKEKRTVS